MSDEIILQRSTIAQKEQTFPTEVIDLPSKGIFYSSSSPLSSGRIELKLMTAKEEDILTSPNLLKKGLAIDKLLESLIVDKTINIGDLLLGDKNAIIFAVRRLAYGDKYGPVELACSKCQAKNQVTIDLAALKDKDVDETKFQPGENLFTFMLPASNIEVRFKLLTDNDEKSIERDIIALGKISKTVGKEITTRLKKMIVYYGGETDVAKIRTLVDNMPSRDSLALRQYVREVTPDVNATFEYVCSECDSEERAAVPMTVQFFWPDARV